MDVRTENVDVRARPLAPLNPLPYRRQVKALRAFHTGLEVLRDAGGPVTRLRLAPKWLMQPVVVVTSPQGMRDVLGSGTHTEKSLVHREQRDLLGPNLFNLPYQPWLPRRRALQPVFTKQRVHAFAGHMAQAADSVTGTWRDGAVVDLDAECRKLTLRALGRAVLGLDLDEQVDAIAEPLTVSLRYVADRSLRPVRAPKWLPTPARRRAVAASDTVHRIADEILQACRADPGREAPLVRALIEATDPDTGRALSDDEIRNDLTAFMFAGHDTTATTLAYTLWALGRRSDIQDRVYDEVAQLGDREPTPEDIPRLGYTVQVLHEALRLCPPAASVGRAATQDIVVDGYRVEAGTLLGVGIYALHRDPALWERPLEFDPDRFSPQNAKNRDRWHYLPFGAGPRSCIGDHFAMLEATLALASVIRKVDIRSVEPDFPMAVPFTLVAGGPIRARVGVRRAEADRYG